MRYGLIIILLFLQAGCAIHHKIMVGDERVIIKQTVGKGDKTYIHVHQNETTALKAARKAIQQQGGSLITLLHSGGRTIVFHLGDQRYEFDPNRIYTPVGIKKTLAQYSRYTPQAYQEVDKLARKIKELLPDGKVVAVHNNATYSLKDYLPGHSLAKDAKTVHLNPDHYFRNFYLVTQLKDYARLKDEGFNGVLQNKLATDDGSLSVYLAKREYINVEAGYDQLTQQVRMLLYA
ncbi:MAG: protein tyrosine phosphatase [Legionella sp.]|nr:MAG: protein tyrosine phosphatase [Legionella sp.]PJD99759.1 MAG: protein tyrosine phosphatase [Legionella sp.]